MTTMLQLTDEVIEGWANDAKAAVALHLRQRLRPVEGAGAIVFPPTYAGGNYNIDSLSDGTRVATIDSVGSQANRMEPMFKAGPRHQAHPDIAELVPQIAVDVGDGSVVSLLDVGHRLGDALVRSSALAPEARSAFEAFLREADAGPIAKLAPTSLVFGVWDSRQTSAKVPRIVQSVIRAWHVDPVRRSATYMPPVDYTALDVLTEEEKRKQEDNSKSPAAQRGFVHNPATDMPGGVVVHGEIVRDLTINLIALRRLDSKANGPVLRQYILGLSLVAATQPLDGFLRQGCLLTEDPDSPAEWMLVARDGKRAPVPLTPEIALAFARKAAKAFGVSDPRQVKFDKQLAKEDVSEGGSKSKKKSEKTAEKKAK